MEFQVMRLQILQCLASRPSKVDLRGLLRSAELLRPALSHMAGLR